MTESAKPLIAGIGSCIVQNFITGIKMICPELAERFDIQFFGYAPNPSGRTVMPPQLDAETYGRMVMVLDEQVLWSNTASPGMGRERQSYLKPDVIHITVPALHFTSLWPLIIEDPRNKPEPDNPWGRYPGALADKLAIQMVKDYDHIDDRMHAYKNTDINTVIDLDRFHELQIADLLEREEKCEIKCAAFILANFRENNLFYTHTHPSGLVYKYLLLQLFNLKKFRDFYKHDLVEMLPAIDHWIEGADKGWLRSDIMAIHPAVAEHFGLKWWSPELRCSTPMGKGLTFDEWLLRYMTESIPSADSTPKPAPTVQAMTVF